MVENPDGLRGSTFLAIDAEGFFESPPPRVDLPSSRLRSSKLSLAVAALAGGALVVERYSDFGFFESILGLCSNFLMGVLWRRMIEVREDS